MPITKTIWQGEVGTRDVIVSVTSVPIKSI